MVLIRVYVAPMNHDCLQIQQRLHTTQGRVAKGRRSRMVEAGTRWSPAMCISWLRQTQCLLYHHIGQPDMLPKPTSTF